MGLWVISPLEMTSVGNMERPARYGEVEAEYQALVDAVSLLDLSYLEFISLEGDDVVSFLQGMTTQDVNALKPGKAADSWFLDSSGRIVAFCRLFRPSQREILIQTSAAGAQPLRDHLDRFLIMEDVDMKVRGDLKCLSLQGPKHKDLLEGLNALHMEHNRCGTGGVDLIISADEAPGLAKSLQSAGAAPTGQLAYDMARLEAYIPAYGSDMNPGHNPVAYGLGGRISDAKGCYVGQETVAMTRDRGRPPQIMVWLMGEGAELGKTGSTLSVQDRVVGHLTSTAYSPKNQAWLGIGLVKFNAAEDGAILTDELSGSWTIRKISNYKANEP